MAFVATLALVCASILRPMELWPWFESLHPLEVLAAIALLGVMTAAFLGRRPLFRSPQLPFLLGFVVVSYGASALAFGAEGIERATTRALIAVVFCVVVMYGASSIGRLRALIAVIVLSGIGVTVVTVHQGLQEAQCVELAEDEADPGEAAIAIPDGRSCTTKSACKEEGRPGAEYVCERVGLFSTMTVERRVRWRGQLDDPNDLAVFIGAIVPFLLVAAGTTKRKTFAAAAFAVIGLELYAVLLTQSRGGQLVIAAVFAAFFVSRYRYRGAVAAALVLPVLFVFGGREGGDSSTDARLELLYDGVELAARHPVLGVGINGFQEELHGVTAHNAYLLAAAELGLPGMFFWTGLLWASLKIPVEILRRPPSLIAPEVRNVAAALVVALLGMGVGIFFLSFTYKQPLFVWLGMCGALYGAVRTSHPEFRVSVGPRDCVGILAFDLVLLAALFVYTRLGPVGR